MAMTTGKTGSSINDINITPMIDVLLVLLVIFMLAQPMMQQSLDVQLPVEKESTGGESAAIVLEIQPGGVYSLNTMPIPATSLEQRLREVYAGRGDKVLFVKAVGTVPYGDVVTAMDAARGAGVEVLGAVLPPGS